MVDLFIVFSLFTRGYSWGCPIFRLIWWFTFALQPWSMDLVLGTLMLTFPNEDPHISLFPLLVNISHSNLAIYIIYRWCFTKDDVPWPIGSMYGIYANIGGILMVNVTIYTIHGSYGLMIYDNRWAKWHLFDTRHFCLCEHCAEHIVRQSPRVCPLCRRAVRSLLGTRDGHVGPLRWLKLVYGQLSCFSKCRMGWDRGIFHGCKWVYIYVGVWFLCDVFCL